MARRIKLTDARIGKLRAGDVEYTVWDTRILGFGGPDQADGAQELRVSSLCPKANPGGSRLGR